MSYGWRREKLKIGLDESRPCRYSARSAAKQKNVASMKAPVERAGDTWTWTAIEAETKLLIT